MAYNGWQWLYYIALHYDDKGLRMANNMVVLNI